MLLKKFLKKKSILLGQKLSLSAISRAILIRIQKISFNTKVQSFQAEKSPFNNLYIFIIVNQQAFNAKDIEEKEMKKLTKEHFYAQISQKVFFFF